MDENATAALLNTTVFVGVIVAGLEVWSAQRFALKEQEGVAKSQ